MLREWLHFAVVAMLEAAAVSQAFNVDVQAAASRACLCAHVSWWFPNSVVRLIGLFWVGWILWKKSWF